MKKVSICLLLNNSDYWGTVYSFERTGFTIVEKKGEFIIKDAPKEYISVIDNVEVELIVGYTNTADQKLIEYFEPIATKIIEIKGDKSEITNVSDAKAYNELFKLAQNQYICVLKPYIFLQRHWLTELIHYYEEVDKSGIVGVCPNFNSVEFLPLPTKELEGFVKVFLPNNNIIKPNGIIFFLKEYLYLVGALDESVMFVGGAEIVQLQRRFFASGYNNYYIPTQSCLITKEYKPTQYNGYEDSNENLEKSLLDMKKAKTYYIPLQ